MNREIEQIIVRDLAGEASGEDVLALSEWLAAGEENKTSFLKCRAYWEAKVAGMTVRDRAVACRRFLRRIDRRERRHAVLYRRLRYAGVAAVVAVVTGLAVYRQMLPGVQAPVEHYSYVTGNSVSTFHLPDGTEISLNKNSLLTCSGDYGVRTREVTLQGEAFFNVVKRPEQAFVVRLGEARITVLGTAFNVKRYPQDSILTATLIRGAIRFESPEQTVLLKPNQQLTCNLTDQTLRIDATDSEIALAWKDNLLKYKSIPFAELIVMLEKQYGVTIRLADRELGVQIVTGTFDTHLPVEHILNLMKKNVAFRWKKKDDYYVIMKSVY